MKRYARTLKLQRGSAWNTWRIAGNVEARTRGDPAAGRETRGRVDGKFINHGDRHGRYLRTQSAREHRKKPICPRLLVDEQKAVAETEVAWKEEEQDGDKRGGREASTRTGERREAAATTGGTRGIRRTPENKRKAHRRRTERGGGGGGEVIVVENRKGGRRMVVALLDREEKRRGGRERKRRKEGEG